MEEEDQNESDIFDWYSTKRTSLVTLYSNEKMSKTKSFKSTSSKWSSLQRLLKTCTTWQQSQNIISRKNTLKRTSSLF